MVTADSIVFLQLFCILKAAYKKVIRLTQVYY